MATKAELERELADLRRQINERPETDETEGGDAATPQGEEDKAASTGHPTIDHLLKGQGIAADEIQQLLDQLNEELGQLPQEKPLLTALGAFGLGFVLGRMSR